MARVTLSLPLPLPPPDETGCKERKTSENRSRTINCFDSIPGLHKRVKIRFMGLIPAFVGSKESSVYI
jgi:hypothetical protein